MSTDGLRIDRIANETIRELAKIADEAGSRNRAGINDGIFSEEDLQYFKQYVEVKHYKDLIENDEVAKRECAAILGGEFSQVGILEEKAAEDNAPRTEVVTNTTSTETTETTETKKTKKNKKKAESPVAKAERRYKELASVSEEELKNFVVLTYGFMNSKKLTAYELLEEYLKKDGIRNADGTYNLQELGGDVIQDATIGADRVLNQNAHGSEISKEQADVTGRIVDNLGVALATLVSDKGVRKYGPKYEREIVENMVDFLGGTVEKNQHKLKEAAEEGFKDGLPAALTMLLNPANYVEQQQLTVLNTAGGTTHISQELLTKLAERLKVEAHNEQDVARITKEVLGEGFSALWNYQVVISAFANAGIALGTTIVMEMLKDVIFGEERDEKAVIKMDPYSSTTNKKDEARRTYLKDYLAIVNSDAGVYAVPKQYKEAINEIAKKFVYQYCTGPKLDENGKVVRDSEGKVVFEYEERFDYTEMYAFLRENGGNDTMNSTELVNAIMSEQGQASMKRHIEIMNARAEKMNADCKEHCECDTEKENEEQENNNVNTEPSDENNGQVASEGIKYIVRNGSVSTWDKMATCYSCLDGLEKATMRDARTHLNFTVAGRIMKLVQCIEDRNYSKERIEALLEIIGTAKNKKEFEEKVTELVGRNEKGVVNFKFEEYYALLDPNGHPMPSANSRFPLELMGCEYEEKDLRVRVTNKGNIRAGKGVEADNMKYAYKDPNGTWIKCDKTVYDQKVAQGYETKKWPDTKLD